jgi:hypothetical protein
MEMKKKEAIEASMLCKRHAEGISVSLYPMRRSQANRPDCVNVRGSKGGKEYKNTVKSKRNLHRLNVPEGNETKKARRLINHHDDALAPDLGRSGIAYLAHGTIDTASVVDSAAPKSVHLEHLVAHWTLGRTTGCAGA